MTKSPYPFFEGQETTKPAKREAKSSKDGKPLPKSNQLLSKPLLVHLLVAISICCCCPQLSASGQTVEDAKLPTVIVRGFLNYRTTVDGTVLLFTPDAGGQQSSSVSVEPSSSISPVPKSSAVDQIVASQLEPQPFRTASPVPHEEPAADHQWHPIQATPPLRPVQPAKTFRIDEEPSSQTPSSSGGRDGGHPEEAADPSTNREPATRSDEPPPISGEVAVLSGVSTDSSSSAEITTRAPAVQPNRPSVQTDELAPAGADNRPGQPQPTRATMKARRPSLGFHGQGARANSRPTNQAGEQSSAADRNSINGIRRPGLASAALAAPKEADSSPASSSSSSSSGAQPVVSAFQSRLQSAKLRNKFRRPGSSALDTQVGGNSTLTSSPLAVGTGGVEAAVAADKEGLQQVGSSASSSVVAGNQWPVSAELQPRLGDIFNPGGSAISPMVGSDEILLDSSSSSSAGDALRPTIESRLGEQRPRAEPELITGGLTGTIENSGAPLTFDSFFQNDQAPTVGAGARPSGQLPNPAPAVGAASEHKPNHLAPRKKNNNDKLNGRLDHHHHHHHGTSKFAPRTPPTGSPTGSTTTQANLVPSFAANIPSAASQSLLSQQQPTPTATISVQSSDLASVTKPAVGSVLDEPADAGQQQQQPQPQPPTTNGSAPAEQALNAAAASAAGASGNESSPALQLQTITKTYSTVMTSLKTRLVPLQVRSSTGVHTLIESYVITKLMTAYQTMPVGEFILPEALSTRAPFEIFNEPAAEAGPDQASRSKEPAASASNFAAPAVAPDSSQQQQEQPITLQENQKSPNDWLHDFTSQNPFNPSSANPQQQQQQLAALLEQQAQDANTPFGLSGEPLDQLASSLDPAALLDGTIQIPDLNNPLVLAAAIQNPQLAAVILAAQQLRFRQQQQRANKPPNGNAQLPTLANNQLQLQPSYSTSLSTNIRPSTYTVRDTMYTTRLVSFKDGRTVRTRTVSEPGSVIEQVLTTMATEITPVTITIRPTGVLASPSLQATAAAAAAASNNQATINNALLATQLASLLARRQQQVQPSTSGVTPSQNQLNLLQQLLAGQQQQLTGATRPQQQQQFQPNIQQLLQSMQQQQQQQQQQQPTSGNSNTNSNANQLPINKPPLGQQQPSAGRTATQDSSGANKPEAAQSLAAATPPLPSLPSKPFVTTLTNLQVRTYTVHNAFKTIYRTITSTQLVTSTVIPAALMRNSQLPLMG